MKFDMAFQDEKQKVVDAQISKRLQYVRHAQENVLDLLRESFPRGGEGARHDVDVGACAAAS